MHVHVQDLRRLHEDHEVQMKEAGVQVVEEIDTENLTEQYAAQVSCDYSQVSIPSKCE